MNLAWVVLVTFAAVIAGTGLCLWVLYQTRGVATTAWTLEQILCPIIRIFVLMIVISQVYPVLGDDRQVFNFWAVFGQYESLRDVVNFLFVVGLLSTFLPILSHPALALPIQSLLTIALVFNLQFQDQVDTLALFPSFAALLKIAFYMLLAYFAMREFSVPLARYCDRKLNVDGSIRLIADAVYLVLQIPVMLIYGSYLKQQLA